MSALNQSGHCLCGVVSYTLAEPPKGYGACHCAMCRRWTGGIELGIQVPADGITWSGDENIATFASSEWAERGWCKTCGANLFWRLTMPGPMQGLLAICAGTLDSLDGLELTQEVYIDHKPAGHAFAGDRHRMTEADVMAMVNAGAEGDTP